MRRITLQVVGLLLIGWGVRTLGSEPFADYLLRDGLLLAAAGAAVFAWGAGGWGPMLPFRRRRGLARHGELLLLTGVIVALGGGLGVSLGLAGILGMAAWIAWGLGLLLIIAGALWPGSPVEYARPGVRWARDAVGRFVAEPAGDATNDGWRTDASPRRWRSETLWVVAVLALAALLRFWDLANLPPGCIGGECTAALRLLDPQPLAAGAANAAQAALNLLAGLLARLGLPPLLSLRLAAGVIGWLTVGALWLGVRRLAPGGAGLLAAALLAVNPWHLWAGRTSDPWVVVAFFTTLVVWCGAEAIIGSSARMWVWAGAAFGLLFVTAGPIQAAVLLWLIALVALGVYAAWRRGVRGDWRWPLAGLFTALVTAAPFLATPLQGHWPVADVGPALNQLSRVLAVLFSPGLVTGGSLAGGPFAGAGLVQGTLAVLALAGLGVLLRHIAFPTAAFVVLGLALLLGEVALAATPAAGPELSLAGLLLPLLPLFVTLAGVALDRVLTALITAWGPPLLRPAQIVAGVALVLALLAGRNTVALMADLNAVGTQGNQQLPTAAARWIADRIQAEPGAATTFVVPRNILDHPSLRLLAGNALAQGRIQPLEWARTLPFPGQVNGSEAVAVAYVLPVAEGDLLALVQELYPASSVTTIGGDSQAPPPLQAVLVSGEEVAQSRNISVTLGDGNASDTAPGTATWSNRLQYTWSTTPPMPVPWRAEWYGTLVVPESGQYVFRVESGAPEGSFALLLDDVLLIDSGLGIREQQSTLARGAYKLSMTYRSGNQPGDLAVLWGKVGEPLEVIGGAALHRPDVANVGLSADYFANDQFAMPTTQQVKDPLIVPDPTVPRPYSVRWLGKLAAPRAGEYLIGAAANGSVEIAVDNLAVVRSASLPGIDQAAGYSEGLIYLPAGWHDIEVRYVAKAGDAEPALQLVWQPPGSAPSALNRVYLLPRLGEVTTADVPLPAPPLLVDDRLGDDRFALARVAETWQPGIRIAPATLPPLPLEALWHTDTGCGVGDSQFSSPHGVTFNADGSQLYVADTGNRRVLVYALDGGLDSVLADPQLEEPVDVVATANGVFVLDATTQQIYRIEGMTLTPLALDTGFYRPRGLGADPLGNLLVADTGGGRVAVLDPSGKLAGAFGGQGSLLSKGQPVDALAIGSGVWVTTAEDGRLWNVAVDGSLTAVPPTSTIDGPHVAALNDGRLLVTDPARSSFVLFSPQGQPLGQFAYSGELVQPIGIAATQVGDGTLIAVADAAQCSLSLWRLGE